jgi:hypothetical protein
VLLDVRDIGEGIIRASITAKGAVGFVRDGL